MLPRLVIDAASMLTCLLVLAEPVALLAATGSQRVVSWLGGHAPENGVSVGVVFDRLLPGLATHARDAAQQLLDPAGYAAAALDGTRAAPPPGARIQSWSASSVLLGLLSVVLALLVAAVALYTNRLPPLLLRGTSRALSSPLRALRAAHSGHLGDYVVWLLLGVTLLAFGLGAR